MFKCNFILLQCLSAILCQNIFLIKKLLKTSQIADLRLVEFLFLSKEKIKKKKLQQEIEFS